MGGGRDREQHRTVGKPLSAGGDVAACKYSDRSLQTPLGKSGAWKWWRDAGEDACVLLLWLIAAVMGAGWWTIQWVCVDRYSQWGRGCGR